MHQSFREFMGVSMIFRIKNKHVVGFKLWLEKLGYLKKELADGGSTFKGKGTKFDYVLIAKDLTGNRNCQFLYEEYQLHLVSPLNGLEMA